jgi:thymidine kinase
MAPEEETERCAVEGCGEPAARSLSAAKVKQVLPDLKIGDVGRRAHLCRQHYKMFRKKTKEERELERAAW